MHVWVSLAVVGVALVVFLLAPLAPDQIVLIAAGGALVAGVAAEVAARLHPGFGPALGRRFDGYWIAPGLTVLAGIIVTAQAEPAIGHAVALITAALLGLVLFVQERELRLTEQGRLLTLSYVIGLYLVAFSLFSAVNAWREAVLLSTLAAGSIAGLLGVPLCRPTAVPIRRVWLLAFVTAVCVSEIALAGSFWIEGGLIRAAFLLLFFYVTEGLVQAYLEGALSPRLLAEYCLVGALGLGLIVYASPWRS